MVNGSESMIGYLFFAATTFLLFSLLGMGLLAWLLKSVFRHFSRKKIKQYDLNKYELVFNSKGEIKTLISKDNKNDIIYV